MRKIPAVLSLIALALMLPATVSATSDPRLAAMGDIGIAVTGTNMQSYRNPASVYFDNNDFVLSLRTSLYDTAGDNQWPYLPYSSFTALFAADMVTMDLDLNYESDNYREDTGNVDLYQNVKIDLNFSAGYGYFSAGVGISAGSAMKRLDATMDNIYDFPLQTLFAPYDRVINSEFIQINAGLMFKYGQLSAGVLLDNILDNNGAETTFNVRTFMAETGFGVYWTRDEYGARGRINNVVYSVGAEVNNLFDGGLRSLNAGAELRFRLVRDSSVSLRLGYNVPFRDMSDNVITTGLGVNVRRVSIDLNVLIPARSTAKVGLSGAVSF